MFPLHDVDKPGECTLVWFNESFPRVSEYLFRFDKLSLAVSGLLG